MNDAPFLFDDDTAGEPASEPRMTDAQRERIRTAFAALGISQARAQFDVVEQLTGQKLSSVGDLERRHAQNLIIGLQHRVRAMGSKRSGNAWADREEDTWIDRL